MTTDDFPSWPVDILRDFERRQAERKNVRDPEAQTAVRALHPESRIWLRRICKSSRRGICWKEASLLVKDQLRQYVKIVDPVREMIRPRPWGRRLYQAWLDYQERVRRGVDV